MECEQTRYKKKTQTRTKHFPSHIKAFHFHLASPFRIALPNRRRAEGDQPPPRRCRGCCFLVFSIFFFVFGIFLLLFRGKLGGANIVAPQLHVENPLYGSEDLLIGSTGATLKIGDDSGCGIALGGKILLRHLGFHLGAGLSDGVSDFLANGIGLDNVVGTVDLGEALAFDVGALLWDKPLVTRVPLEQWEQEASAREFN